MNTEYMKRILFFMLALAVMSCNRTKVIIHGQFEGADQRMIRLEEMENESTTAVDSALTRRHGNFRFVYNTKEPQYLLLSFSENERITLLVEPGEKLTIHSRFPGIYNGLTLEGSPGSIKVTALDKQFRETVHKLDSLRSSYNAFDNTPENKEQKQEWADEYTRILNKQRTYSIGFVLENIRSLASIMALYQKIDENTYVLYKTTDLQYMKIVLDSISRYYPESKYTKGLASDFATQMAAYRNLQFQNIIKQAGTGGLNIRLPNPQGDTLAFSTFHGKYVLLSFWATWNAESVRENLALKSFYMKYHPKGFEVYQVSLDNSLDAWKNAIQYNELPWENVSELAYPNSRTDKIFNVQQLPANFMFGPDGDILGKNLFGNDLRVKLSQIFD